jgi:uncharacterized membrane protein
MTLYDLTKFLHIFAAVVWVGGAITLQLLAIRIERSNDSPRMVQLAHDAEFVGQRVFFPASLLVLLLGIGLVVENEVVGFTDLWIIFGLVGIAFSALTGSLFLGPESGRVGKLIDAEGAESPEVQRRLKRIFLISRIELVVLTLVVFDMVIRPGS